MVDPELFEDYRRAMETVARLAHDATSELVADIDPFGDPTQNALRLLAGYPEIVARYGTVAVTAAREYYERSRELAVEAGEIEEDDGYEAVDAPTVRREWAEEDVRKAAGEGIDLLAGEAVRRVMQRGDQTIAMNAMRDPAHPMWAIVPHAGACGWCVMVASNGWAYSSERSANAQRHANCKCTVAVDFDLGNPSLRGYDPDALYGRYRRGIADAGGEGGIRARWDALSPEERARYKRKGRSAYDVFKTKEITKAMDARIARDVNTDGRSVGAKRYDTSRSGNVIINEKRFGKKITKHCRDWGLDPSSREDRQSFYDIACDIIDNADEIVSGNTWRDQPLPCTFYRKGEHVVIVNGHDEFVTIMRGGANNRRFLAAKKEEYDQRIGAKRDDTRNDEER